MKLRSGIIRVLFAALSLAVCASLCAADSMWDFQIVDEIGYGIHPKVWADETDPNNRVTVEGVALAGFDEILDPSAQYSVFLQDDNSDRGGIQAWTGKFFYGDAMWALLRTTDYIDFQAGDRLRISGLLADMSRGKVVINNRGHSGAPNLVWHVEILGHPGLPDPELIPSVSDCNYFDQTRAGGGERYQTRYVMLHGVIATGGDWANNKLLSIQDETGEVGMLLAAVGDFNDVTPPTGKLNVVGIFDQEDDQTPPYTDGYRVWIKRMADVAIALDNCREVKSRDDGERVALINKVVSRVYDGYFYVQDVGRSGGVKVVSGRSLTPGDVVALQGLVISNGGEKAIEANYISVSESGDAPRPVFVNSSVINNDFGLDAYGLLTRVCGRMGDEVSDGVYNFSDGAGSTLIKSNGVVMPEQGSMAALTAVASKSNGTPLLLLKSVEDIQTLVE